MTLHKNLKRRVRARMEKTGERYSAARRNVLAQSPSPGGTASRAITQHRDPADFHFPGCVPAATALRVLLAAAAVKAPHTQEPFSEAMVSGIAGGLGAGVFAFHYAKEDFSSFFIAGRHNWADDLDYLKDGLARFGLKAKVQESAGAKTADQQLRSALAGGKPVVAWVDLAYLPRRAMPQVYQGGGYHVVTIYALDDAAGTALIGDLADEPVSVPLEVLAESRGRIKKQKNRLLWIEDQAECPPLAQLVAGGLRACCDGLTKGRMKNFTLAAFEQWGQRMHGSTGKDSWQQVFPRGHLLWTGLTMAHDFIEHYGSGGGLMRPLMAEFLDEAAQAIGKPALIDPMKRYSELGRAWSDLADAALPDYLPLCREAKRLLAEKAELTFSGDDDAPQQIRGIWSRLEELRASARECFPLNEAQCEDLRADLKSRILAIHEQETAACAALDP